MKTWCKWLLVCCLAAGLSCGAAVADDELPVVKIAYRKNIDDLPFYVAIERGYCKEEGIQLEMVNISGTQNILSASMRGDINGGPLSPSDAFLLAQRKIPIKIVTWLGHAHKGTKCGIHVAAQSDIHALSDLKGRRIGVSTSINSKVLLTEAARKGGVAEKGHDHIVGRYAGQSHAVRGGPAIRRHRRLRGLRSHGGHAGIAWREQDPGQFP